jgi:3-hydroxyisobutyrate dehydrogenase-like beta-hydroxyacid dehydrogenase
MEPTGTVTLGFIGLGSMGAAMAGRLVDAGHDVLVWNRSKDAVAELVAKGAREAQTPEEALGADISFSMLANDAAVEAVLSAEAIPAAAGRIHVVTASISPALADRLATAFEAAGVVYLSAPVLGRPEVAAAGQLNILAAGPSAVIDTVEPFFLAMGKRVWRLGETPSVANAVKASVNYNIIHALQAIGESVAMTERLGVDPELFTELLSSTLFGGIVYTGYGKLIATQNYKPAAFTAALGAKDLGLAEQVAIATGVTPATMPALKHVFEVVLADAELGPDADWSAIAEVSRRDL